MRNTFNPYPDHAVQTNFGYNEEGFIVTDMGYNQYSQPQQPHQPQQQSFNSNMFIPNFANNAPAETRNFSFANEFLNNAALQYGSNIMEQGTDLLQRNIDKYVPTSTIKYYFAVDNNYVAKKLMLLIFPFAHMNWAIQYNHDKQPVPPRYDINAPDLYIPFMGLLTYVLTCGLMFGIKDKFSPDQLGGMASNAVGWLVVEILILMLILYIVNARTSLRYMDMVAFSGYKFVGMNVILICSLLLESVGYYSSLAYFSVSLGYFLIRTLKIQILPQDDMTVSEGNKKRVYLLLFTALVQPFIMWLLTKSVVFN